MQTLRWVRMSDEERDAFLGNGGTGVLSFSTGDDPPYSLPMSYGYDADTEHFHYRLSFPEGGGKDHLVDRPVTFVTHRRTDEGWRSVVATGELEELSELPYESTARQERWNVTIPLVDIFGEPPDEMSFREFRLVPETLSGRKEVGSQE